MHIDKICRKLKIKYKFKYDINAILSNLIYERILEPSSKLMNFMIVYRALDVLGTKCDLIQLEVYKNSHFLGTRNDKVLYCDFSNYYFKIEQKDGSKK